MRSTIYRFVDLILRYKGTKGQMGMRLRGLTDEEKNILLELVRAAEFMPYKLVVGKAIKTVIIKRELKKHLINNICPFKVVDRRKKTLYDATRFLEYAIWSVGSPKALRKRCYEELVDYIVSVVKDSIPFDPIKLSREKDGYLSCFSQYGSSFLEPQSFVRRPKDNDTIPDFIVGVHLGCRGVMYRDLDEISCARCWLKIFIPSDVVTYGDLRRYLLSVTA